MDNMILLLGSTRICGFIQDVRGLGASEGEFDRLRLMAPMDMIPSKHWQRVIGVMDRSG